MEAAKVGRADCFGHQWLQKKRNATFCPAAGTISRNVTGASDINMQRLLSVSRGHLRLTSSVIDWGVRVDGKDDDADLEQRMDLGLLLLQHSPLQNRSAPRSD